MIPLAPGDVLRVALQSLNTSDVPTDADATPAFALWRNGAVDGAVSFTVTKPASTTGLYMAQCTIPTTYAEGDYLEVRATYALSSANRAEILARIRATNRLNAIEGLAENALAQLSQMAQAMIFIQAEINIIKNQMNLGFNLSATERLATAEAVWDTPDGLDVAASVAGVGGVPGAPTTPLTNHDFTRNGITVRHRTNADNTYRHVSRV